MSATRSVSPKRSRPRSCWTRPAAVRIWRVSEEELSKTAEIARICRTGIDCCHWSPKRTGIAVDADIARVAKNGIVKE